MDRISVNVRRSASSKPRLAVLGGLRLTKILSLIEKAQWYPPINIHMLLLGYLDAFFAAAFSEEQPCASDILRSMVISSKATGNDTVRKLNVAGALHY